MPDQRRCPWDSATLNVDMQKYLEDNWNLLELLPENMINSCISKNFGCFGRQVDVNLTDIYFEVLS
jgi:hypothetical protein